MKRQSIGNQRGEVVFRKKLSEQQVDGTEIFGDEANREEIEGILRERMRETRADMAGVRARGVPLSPYVEIGAERGQRSLVLENDLGAHGAATDISFHMLKSCAYYAAVFDRGKMPLRVCCDAYRLPFMSGSVPLVFCYATLHHFPDPIPIVRQAYRILAPGGSFLFGDEPYKKSFHLPLYTRERQKASKYRVMRLIDFVFSRRTGNEERYGIVENHQIAVSVWRRAFSVFETKDIALRSYLNAVASPLFAGGNPVKFIGSRMIGGTIGGMAGKAGAMGERQGRAIEDLLICPACLDEGREIALARADSRYTCRVCNALYPIVDNIVLLLPRAQICALYPEHAAGHRVGTA